MDDPDAGDDGSTTRRLWFEALFTAESRAILGYALRRTQAAEDAADVVAETFLVAWRRIEDVPRGPDARLWLYGVARRVLANHLRGAERRHRLGERLRAQLMEHVEVAYDHDAHDAVDLVRQAMLRLDEDDRELLQLTNWEGLTPTELATAMSVPAATVRTRLHRARKRLKVELGLLGWFGERSDRSGHVSGVGHVPARLQEET